MKVVAAGRPQGKMIWLTKTINLSLRLCFVYENRIYENVYQIKAMMIYNFLSIVKFH